MKQEPVFFAVAMAAAGAAQAEQPWTHVGSVGQRQFVLVDPDAASDAATLKRAAEAVCEPGKACVVVFWSEAAAVPSQMPMTRPQQQAAVAQYFRNPASGSEELLMRCPANAPLGSKCLR